MTRHRADVEPQDEVPFEDAVEQSEDVDADTLGEEEYPPDAVGFDGTPIDQLQEERRERLDPANRPENSEVSNAGRDFDEEKGMFTDEAGYDEAEKKFDPDAS